MMLKDTVLVSCIFQLTIYFLLNKIFELIQKKKELKKITFNIGEWLKLKSIFDITNVYNISAARKVD